MLTLSDFLDATYALAVEDHTRINPLQGVEAAAERWLPVSDKRVTVPKPVEVQTQNKSAYDALQAMLAPVQNSPVKKPRKRK